MFSFATLIASAAACQAVPCADKSVALVFNVPVNTGAVLQADYLAFTTDGQVTVLPTSSTNQNQSAVRLVLDGVSFARFAGARRASVTIGTTTFEMTPAAQQSLRALANRMVATHTD